MLRGAIFDFDGVLVDSERAHFEAFRVVLARTAGFEITFPEYTEKELLLDTKGLLELFHGVVSADDVVNFKPHPEPYLKARALVGADASAAGVVAFEDSLAGMTSARTAQLRVIGVTNSFVRPLGLRPRSRVRRQTIPKSRERSADAGGAPDAATTSAAGSAGHNYQALSTAQAPSRSCPWRWRR